MVVLPLGYTSTHLKKKLYLCMIFFLKKSVQSNLIRRGNLGQTLSFNFNPSMPPIEVSWDTLDLFKKCLTQF